MHRGDCHCSKRLIHNQIWRGFVFVIDKVRKQAKRLLVLVKLLVSESSPCKTICLPTCSYSKYHDLPPNGIIGFSYATQRRFLDATLTMPRGKKAPLRGKSYRGAHGGRGGSHLETIFIPFSGSSPRRGQNGTFKVPISSRLRYILTAALSRVLP